MEGDTLGREQHITRCGPVHRRVCCCMCCDTSVVISCSPLRHVNSLLVTETAYICSRLSSFTEDGFDFDTEPLSSCISHHPRSGMPDDLVMRFGVFLSSFAFPSFSLLFSGLAHARIWESLVEQKSRCCMVEANTWRRPCRGGHSNDRYQMAGSPTCSL